MNFPIATILILTAAGARAEETPLAIFLKTPPGQMRYDKAQFSVPPGARVVLTLENNDEMPHNIVICKPGDDKGMEVAKLAWAMGEQGMLKDWVPEHERVLVSGRMAPPHGRQEYAFTAPTEPGNYPYVCTFPGHAMTMNGTMRVAAEGPRIQDLAFKLYLGNWNKLPDFSKLTPSREGKLPENLLGWKFDDYKNEFGVVFNGKLKAPKAGDYQFFLSSDDGSDVLIDGKSVIKADGVHPAGGVQTKTYPLQAGEHSLEVRYFQGGGEAELYVAWAGPGFSETRLSDWVHPSRGDGANPEGNNAPGIVLAPEGDRPVIYRNFLEGSSPRGIAVGYPGGFNVCFDADQMNLAMLWRGAFIDAHKHWTDRGGGNQSPLGYAVIQPVPTGVGIAVLEDPVKTAWPERKRHAEGLNFHGYTLDQQGRPTFSYSQGDMKIEESYTPSGTDADPKARIVRTLKLSGTANPNTFLRAAVGEIKSENGTFALGNSLILQIEGAAAQIRGNELLIPLGGSAGKEIRISYQWAL